MAVGVGVRVRVCGGAGLVAVCAVPAASSAGWSRWRPTPISSALS